MHIDEREASTKLCPFFGPAVIVAGTQLNGSATSLQAVQTLGDSLFCRGSRCMAWRGGANGGRCGLVPDISHEVSRD